LHKKVKVTGLIKQYKGKPEIILKSTNQIEIIE
jgi:DNA/RNA endonuclease YhcR with UshA esterase domain